MIRLSDCLNNKLDVDFVEMGKPFFAFHQLASADCFIFWNFALYIIYICNNSGPNISPHYHLTWGQGKPSVGAGRLDVGLWRGRADPNMNSHNAPRANVLPMTTFKREEVGWLQNVL